jgi:hypothetical protein
MKLMNLATAFYLALSLWAPNAQAQAEDPAAVLDQAFKPLEALNQKYIAYSSAVAHSSARKSERKFRDYMAEIDNANGALSSVPYYKGDKSLHNGIREYLKLVGNVMNENYGKVVNMEEIAEQSYDNMEAYILLNKKVDEKMTAAGEKLNQIQADFCAKNGITLLENTSNEGSKIDKIGDVLDYKNVVYLIFFKCAWQNDELVEALNQKNVTKLEQARGSLKTYAEEGLARLDTLKSYKGDASLKNACRQALQFFKREADRASGYTDFNMKEQAFEQQRKSFAANAKARNDQAEIDKYNKAVEDMNKASKLVNELNSSLNRERTEAYNTYNKASANFLDTHIPYAKK